VQLIAKLETDATKEGEPTFEYANTVL
jgi:hypothetical protein